MDSNPEVCKIKKYPNRRFYDTSRSRHVTLDELYEFVRGGQCIQVTDSNTGADITSLVLTQMILERESPKLDLFPAGLLHQVIQANQSMLHSFVERYFNRALNAFLQSQQDFDAFLQRSGLPVSGLAAPWQWARSFMNQSKPSSETEPGTEPPSPVAPPPMESHAIQELRAQLTEMSHQLSRLQSENGNGRGSQPHPKRASRKPKHPRRREN